MGIVKLTPRPDLGDGYYDEIEFSGGIGVPPRPRPPGFPDIPWGPDDPRPTHPITGIPGFPPPLGPPPGGVRPPSAPVGANATVVPLPKTDPPAVPPEGMPAGSFQALVWFGPGTKPAQAWIGPYASTGPVTPPTTEAEPTKY